MTLRSAIIRILVVSLATTLLACSAAGHCGCAGAQKKAGTAIDAPPNKPACELKLPSAEQKASVETALREFAKTFSAETALTPERLFERLDTFVKSHPAIVGATFAFAPVTENGKIVYNAPYVSRKPGEDKLNRKNLGEADYTSASWYVNCQSNKDIAWSEPYFDTVGAGINMITASYPVYADSAKTKLSGVVTADMPLD